MRDRHVPFEGLAPWSGLLSRRVCAGKCAAVVARTERERSYADHSRVIVANPVVCFGSTER